MLAELWKRYKGKWWVWGVLIAFFLIMIPISWKLGKQVYDRYTDFSIFYTAGWNYFNGDIYYGKIYENLPEFWYPPICAFLFGLLAFTTPVKALFIFNVINVAIFPIIIVVIIKILHHLDYKWNSIYLALFLAFIASFRYYSTNFSLGQVNEIQFLLILFGLLYTVKEQFYHAAIFFTLASFIKIFPVIFLIWLFTKKFNLRIVATSFSVAMFLVLIPILYRGIDLWSNDIELFITKVIKPHLFDNEIFSIPINQSLAGALYRLFTPLKTNVGLSFNIFNASIESTKFVILIIKSILLISFIYFLIIRRLRKLKINLLEISLIFLFIHLYSSVTWKNHLVTLLIVFIPLFQIEIKKLKSLQKTYVYLTFVLIFISSLSYKPIIGEYFKTIIDGSNVITLTLCILYVHYLYSLLNPKVEAQISGNS